MQSGRWAIAAVLLLAACSEEPVAPRPEAILSHALDAERPSFDLQQVHRIQIAGKPAFCGTIGPKSVHTMGSGRQPVEEFLFKDDRFHWPAASAEGKAAFDKHCAGRIVAPDKAP